MAPLSSTGHGMSDEPVSASLATVKNPCSTRLFCRDEMKSVVEPLWQQFRP